MHHTSRGLLLLTACFAGTTLSAQQLDPVFLGTLRIEGAEAQALLGNDQITSEEIARRNPATVRDVFAGESSVSVSGGAAIAQKVFVNGIEESLLSITIDGARQNKSAFHHTGNVLLDPALLKSVEISKGLAPADAGPGALAGAIAYQTKDARDLLEEGESFGGLMTLGATTNSKDIRSTLTLFGRQGGAEFLLSGTRQTGSDYKDGSGKTVEGTEADLTDLIAKLAYTTGSGKRLSFAASRTEDTGRRAAQAGPGGLFFTRPDFAEVVGRPNVLIDGYARRESYTLTWTDEAPEGWFAPSLQLSYNEQEIDASGVWGLNTSLSGTAKNVWQLGNGTLTAGLDFFDETAKGRGRGTGAFASSGQEEMWNLGLFAQARQDLGARVSVSYGLRYDIQEFEGADGSRFDGSGLSANGSVDVILTDTLTLNAGLASSWGGYELGEAALVDFGGAWNYAGFTTSRANAARLGLRHDSGPWSVSGALFRTEVDDISAVLPTGGARGATADLTSTGFEGALRWTGAQGFAALNYTYADVELNGDAVGSTAYYLGRPVGHVIALEGGWDVNDHWRVGGSAEIALKNTDTAVTLPGYEVVNLHAVYTPKALDGVQVRLDLRNVLDATYEARSSDGIDAASVIALTEPGRSVGLTATFRF
ncbi:TonB-dependent receptor domain-containing protein [Rhodovulum steppense]|uniref:Hemoglobin/transferrin/lactoferrin receptor protein n=1 Tax=Rhodovulum steppense TaxID=540251 RepID=A0A4R1YJB2_9RHOB|nr:TonB-dependent receptor [Rhodovulum steppense]TCM76559.1 hemoglobin/transferrin/lactoferrin receptor protein [Rhodovulum steppense]